jgi:RNase H-fold protein (predicted Holliday junction resolvase)
MLEGVYLGFDFGYKRIGVAVGNTITKTSEPLKTVSSNNKFSGYCVRSASDPGRLGNKSVERLVISSGKTL